MDWPPLTEYHRPRPCPPTWPCCPSVYPSTGQPSTSGTASHVEARDEVQKLGIYGTTASVFLDLLMAVTERGLWSEVVEVLGGKLQST